MKPLSKRNFYFLVFIIGCAYAFTLFNFSFITEQSVYWTQPFGDRITNHIGLLYFIHDNWRWPLFYVPSLAFPEGTNIIYTDSIPLLALIVKLLFKTTGLWFNYFGIWLFLCFPLLALFMALAAKEGKCEDPVGIIGIVLLALSSPALLIRFGHTALMGHFLIAWAFFLYLKYRNAVFSHYLTLQFVIVAVLCILLQTYFLLMVIPFFVSALLQGIIEKRTSLKSAASSFIIVILSILSIAFISGMIGSTSPNGSAGGFGLYSMNILSPFLPPREHLPHFISQYIHWDGNGYSWDATGGQYEGYNYLGAGVLFLLLLQSFCLPILKQFLKRNIFLVLALAGLILLALSNLVYLGDKLVLHVSVNHWFDYFRTSGRLFWPVYYVLVVTLVLSIIKRFSSILARSIIIVAVLAQLADTQILRTNMIAGVKSSFPQVLSKQAWDDLLAVHHFIVEYPSFQCGGWAGNWPANNSNMELLLMAAQQNKPTNSAYLARTSRNCMMEATQSVDTKIEPGGLYIFGENFPMRNIEDTDNFEKWCRKFAFGYVCTQNTLALDKLAVFPEFKIPVKTPIPNYTLGETLRFTSDGNGDAFLRSGWYGAEQWGTWSAGTNSELALKIPNLQSNKYILTIYARGFVNSEYPEKKITVYISNKKIALWIYNLNQNVVQYTTEISREYFQKDGTLRINFISDEATSPQEAGLSEDTRKISLGLIDMSIKSAN